MRYLLPLMLILTACAEKEICSDSEFYPGAQVKQRICVSQKTGDTLRVENFHPNGQLQSAGQFENRKRHGQWQSFYENGNLWSQHYYTSGKLNGPYKVWYENREPRIEGQFQDGKEVGNWKFYNEHGELIKEEILNK